MSETFHKSATHTDAHGMPVAFSEADKWPFHPTPCCGAAVSIFSDDGVTYCKACYAEQDPMMGGMPEEPFKPIHRTTITKRGGGWGFRCSCGEAPNVSSKQRRVAEGRADMHRASVA